MTVLPEAHLWHHTPMWDRKAWLSVCALIHPKGVLSGWGQDSVQASQVHPHQTLSSRKGPSPNCSHRVGSWNCPTSLVMLKHSEFLSLELRGPSRAPEEQPHTTIPLQQTLHLAQYSQTGIVLLATAKPTLVHQIARWRRAIRPSR